MTTPLASDTTSIASRLGAVDWAAVTNGLRDRPYARLGCLLSPSECHALVALYDDDRLFRSRVEMERHRFGIGDYKYFAHPLPLVVDALRHHAYPPLAAIANSWPAALSGEAGFPPDLEEFLAACRRSGQARPTPLLLHYETGGYNCLHQDVYGAVAFPLQLVVFLSEPGKDYEGGEFLLVQQRPRAQSIGEAITARQGEALVFANRHWPAAGARGAYRVNVRHGVSRIHRGTRFALGVIFHDAE